MPQPASEEEFVTELTVTQSALQAFIVSLMPGDSGVDEVMQRTNITLWRKRDDYQSGTNFRAWAFECAKWTMRAYFKEKQRKSWLIIDDDLTRAVTERMIESLPAAADATQAALRLCLERLRPIDRELVLAHYEGGESLAECAQRSGRTPGTVKVTLFRLRGILRRCISDRLATGAA
ncbi:MAG: sigma-70 family RNA polymerase sigma factor [Luteolibacter sp.]